MQLILLVLIVLVLLYVIGRLRKAFHFDTQAARTAVSEDMTVVRQKSASATRSTSTRLGRLADRLEAYASSEEK